MKHLRSLLLLLVVASPTTALADPKAEAKAHIENATAFHAEGKFKEALEQLTLAYALDPRPELLYAIGQVHVQLGNCTQAINFYERFLQTKPAAGPAAAAKEAIETCKTAPPDTPEPEPEPQQQPDPEPPPPDPDPPPMTRVDKDEPAGGKPFYKDALGMGLVGGGIALGVASVIFYTQMNGALDDAEDAPTFAEHGDLRDEATSKRNLSVGLAIGSAALLGAGVVRFITRDTGERTNKVAVTPTGDGGLITWMGRF